MSPKILALSLLALALTACTDKSNTDSARPNADTTLNQENAAGAPRQDVTATEVTTTSTTTGMAAQPSATPSPMMSPTAR